MTLVLMVMLAPLDVALTPCAGHKAVVFGAIVVACDAVAAQGDRGEELLRQWVLFSACLKTHLR